MRASWRLSYGNHLVQQSSSSARRVASARALDQPVWYGRRSQHTTTPRNTRNIFRRYPFSTGLYV